MGSVPASGCNDGRAEVRAFHRRRVLDIDDGRSNAVDAGLPEGGGSDQANGDLMAGRPTYERERDRIAEEEIIIRWCEHYKFAWEKLPGGYALIDFAIFKPSGPMEGVAEVKDRPGWKDQYGTVFLSLQKMRELYLYYEMGIPAVFIIRTHGTIIRHVRIDARVKDWSIWWAGRRDRDDPDDLEPCYHIPIDDFKTLNETVREQ